MSWLDLSIIVIVAGFALAGFWLGFIHTLGSLLGTVFSLYVAARYYEPLSNWLIAFTGWGENVSKVIVFIVAFLIISRLVGLLFWILEKFINVVTYLPFMKSLNRILGLVFGFFEGVISVGIVIYFIERFPLSSGFMQALADSSIAAFASNVVSRLSPFIPDALEFIRSSVDYVEQVIR